jgi:shikimate kinase
MNYFIIIRGPLGVGKTTIAKKLAKTLKAKYISIDEMLEKHGLAKTEGDYLPDDFIKANNFIIPEVEEKLSAEKITILEGNFYFQEQIEHLIKNLPFPNFVLTLKAPLEVCIKRDNERKIPYGKESAEAVYHLVSRFDYGEIIDTENKSADQVIKEIISYLPKS